MIFKTTHVDYDYFISTKQPVIANTNSNQQISFYEGILFNQKGKLFSKNFSSNSLTAVPIDEFFKVDQLLELVGCEINSLNQDKYGFTYKMQSKQGSVYLKKSTFSNFWGASLVHNYGQIIPVSTVNEVLYLLDETN